MIVGGLAGLFVVGGGVCLFQSNHSLEDQFTMEASKAIRQVSSVSPSAERLTVHIAGAVQKPGVYSVPKGLRVYQVLPFAGGAFPDANLDKLNLAQKVKDGQRILVVASTTKSARVLPESLDKVDLNTASQTTLEAIPGIGPSLTRAILRYRNEHGRFATLQGLTNVTGIGPKKFQKIGPYLRVN